MACLPGRDPVHGRGPWTAKACRNYCSRFGKIDFQGFLGIEFSRGGGGSSLSDTKLTTQQSLLILVTEYRVSFNPNWNMGALGKFSVT